ncbi:MAG: LysM peptidoglycan-binding domain-containing protein [Planctomycetota bacterium]
MTRRTLPILVAATLPLLLPACGPFNRMVKEDTGTIERVPGPPPAQATFAAEPMPGEEVTFVDPMPNTGSEVVPLSGAGAVEPEPTPLRTYTVQNGDNYWKIAKNVYGDPMRMRDIEAANPGVDPKKLQIGDEIFLPE